jgi:phospholipid transport system substrate-binding protein
MFKLKSIIPFLFAILGFLPAQADPNQVSSYVDKILNEFVSIASNSSLSDDAKVSQAKDLIAKNLDVDWMSKFVLGRYRRGISPEEITTFTSTYHDYVVAIYASAVKQYKGQKVQVNNIRNVADNEFAVKTSIVRAGQDPLLIDYMVRVYPGNVYKVFDVITEGVSLITSQQAEFTNTIGASSIEALRQDLIAKMKSPEVK